jgi:hypothetical protein
MSASPRMSKKSALSEGRIRLRIVVFHCRKCEQNTREQSRHQPACSDGRSLRRERRHALGDQISVDEVAAISMVGKKLAGKDSLVCSVGSGNDVNARDSQPEWFQILAVGGKWIGQRRRLDHPQANVTEVTVL